MVSPILVSFFFFLFINRGLNDICRVTKDLQQMLDQIRYEGSENNIIDNYFVQRGLKLVNGHKGNVNQGLQITYSFPFHKAMFSLRALSSFFTARQAEKAKWVIDIDHVLFSHLITFIDNDQDLRNYPEHVKFFLFVMLQNFSYGSLLKCRIGRYAKLIAGLILLRTNMYEFVNHGGQQSVRHLLRDPLNTVVEAFDRFRDYFNPIRGNIPSLEECVTHPTCVGQCFRQSKTYYFAKTYDLSKKFPFSANEYFQNLFRNNGKDLFSTHGEDFDHAFGRFGLNVDGQATVIYELRMLHGFYYDGSPQTATVLHSRIPTFFHLGNEIMNHNSLQNINVGVNMCDHQHRLVPLQDPQPEPPTRPQQQHLPAPQQQSIHNMREERRNVNDAIRDQRRNSMPNLGEAPKNTTPTTYKEAKVTVLSNEEPNNISILREARRKVRVQKRFDRELRRTTETRNNSTQQPTKDQIKREATRLAREKKRLAREEKRDVKAGVKPVTDQDLKQIIQQQKKKKKQIQQTMIPATPFGRIRHQVVKKNRNGVRVKFKLRLYE